MSYTNKIQEERDRLNSLGNPEGAKRFEMTSMKETVMLFNQSYRDSDKNVDIEKIYEDLGLESVTGATSNSINISGSKVTIASVGDFGSKELKRNMVINLGVYLFAENGGYGHINSEDIEESYTHVVQSFELLMLLPILNLNAVFTIPEMIEWSIEYKLPLPVIRNVLSL